MCNEPRAELAVRIVTFTNIRKDISMVQDLTDFVTPICGLMYRGGYSLDPIYTYLRLYTININIVINKGL